MGAASSSEKEYKLRTVSGASSRLKDAKRLQAGLPLSSSSGRVVPSDKQLQKQKSTLKRGNSKMPVAPLENDETPSDALPVIIKKPSRLNRSATSPAKLTLANEEQKETNNSRLTPPGTPKVKRQPSKVVMAQQVSSSNLLSRSPSIIAAGGGAGGRKDVTLCSTDLPWLIKQTNTTGTSLGDYELGRVIGRGLMGTVRIARNKKGKYLVFKAVSKEYIVKHNDQRHVQNEKEILKTLECSFCVKMFGTFQDKLNIYYALQFVPGGELFQRLGRKKKFPPAVAKFYISEVFVAIEHVQELGYVYRDLKPENILLDEEGHCKLVDFGFSINCPDNTTKLQTLCGTPAYLSPEQLDGKFTNGYTRVVDWWSFGVLLYELNVGRTPFSKSNKESHYEIFLRILNKKISFPWGFDGDSKDLVMKLCHAQVDKRLCEPDSIKKHKYFEMPWDAVAQRQLVPPFVPRIRDEGDIHYFRSYPFSGPKAGSDDGDARYGYFDF